MNQKNYILLFVFFLISSSILCAQEIKTTSLNYKPLPQTGQKNNFIVADGQTYFSRINYQGTGKLFQFKGKWLELNSSNSGILSENVHHIFSHSKKIYFATTKGISILDNGNWTSIHTSNSNIASDQIYRLYVDKDIILALTQSGASFKKSGESSWTNVPYTKLLTTSTFGIRTEYLNYKDNSIYIGLGIRRKLIEYNMATKNSKMFDGTSIAIAKSSNTIYTMDEYNKIHIVGDTLSSLTKSGICALEHPSNYFTLVMSPQFFVDNKDDLWQLHRAPDQSGNPRGDLFLGSIQNNKYNVVRKTIPFKFDNTVAQLFSYDSSTDSFYSFSDALAVSMKDVRAEMGSFEKNLATLDINQISTPITNQGNLHFDHNFKSLRMEATDGECKSPIYSSGLWIGGLDENDSLHTAAMTYRQKGVDFWPGPLSVQDGSYNPNDSAQYDRVWKVSRHDISNYLDIFQKNGLVLESQTTDAIWDWPAHGKNGNAEHLAPFFDYNSNGTYEPAQGDYPMFPGDQCVYWIMNDAAHSHTETGGRKFGLEIHGMAYAYNCPTLDAQNAKYGINTTTFYKYTIVNRSDSNYKNVVIGKYIDPDLGYFGDDYIGCHVTQNLGFAYNGDALDEGDLGYGKNAPMISSLILNAPTFEHDGVDGDGDGKIDEADEKRFMGSFGRYYNDFTVFGNPNEAIHYYNYLTAKWKNGDPFTYDGVNGHTGSESTKYLFSGTSDPARVALDWTEWTAGNAASDRRFIQSTYEFDLKSKDTAVFEHALIFSRDDSKYEQLAKNLEYVTAIKEWYYSTGDPKCSSLSIKQNKIEAEHLSVYPNPSNSKLNIESEFIIEHLSILNVNGVLIEEISNLKTKKIHMDITDFPAGVYFMQVKTSQGELSSKLIKME